MASNINIEFQGDFQYLKYEFAPRLRTLIKNVHTAMNSYNNAFFLQCKKFGDVQAISKEALETGKLPSAVVQAMLKADAFKPISEAILLKKVANQISSFAFFNTYYWHSFGDNYKMRRDLGVALRYALLDPFLHRINGGKSMSVAVYPEFVDFYATKPFWGNNDLMVAPIKFSKKVKTDRKLLPDFPRINTTVDFLTTNKGGQIIPLQEGVGKDNPYQTRQERLGEIFSFYFLLNNEQVAYGQPLVKKGVAQKYYFFSKKDFYTLSEECIMARLWNFFGKRIFLNVPSAVDIKPDTRSSQSPVCDYFAHEKFLTTQGSFAERLKRFAVPKTGILQVPAFTDEEIQEGFKIIASFIRPYATQKPIYSANESYIRFKIMGERNYSETIQKIRYYESKARTNHLELGTEIDRYSNTKIKALPAL